MDTLNKTTLDPLKQVSDSTTPDLYPQNPAIDPDEPDNAIIDPQPVEPIRDPITEPVPVEAMSEEAYKAAMNPDIADDPERLSAFGGALGAAGGAVVGALAGSLLGPVGIAVGIMAGTTAGGAGGAAVVAPENALADDTPNKIIVNEKSEKSEEKER